tara:strand:+ start:2706 stop:3608 length:903 start_codon:yes stop_codon:yes gene_type:complete
MFEARHRRPSSPIIKVKVPFSLDSACACSGPSGGRITIIYKTAGQYRLGRLQDDHSKTYFANLYPLHFIANDDIVLSIKNLSNYTLQINTNTSRYFFDYLAQTLHNSDSLSSTICSPKKNTHDAQFQYDTNGAIDSLLITNRYTNATKELSLPDCASLNSPSNFHDVTFINSNILEYCYTNNQSVSFSCRHSMISGETIVSPITRMFDSLPASQSLFFLKYIQVNGNSYLIVVDKAANYGVWNCNMQNIKYVSEGGYNTDTHHPIHVHISSHDDKILQVLIICKDGQMLLNRLVTTTAAL